MACFCFLDGSEEIDRFIQPNASGDLVMAIFVLLPLLKPSVGYRDEARGGSLERSAR